MGAPEDGSGNQGRKARYFEAAALPGQIRAIIGPE
jgi:hypothetical protein